MMNGEGERAEAGVRADVRGRLLAADVLLARREREHEAALALGIDRLADEPAGHLAHEFRAAWRTARHRARRTSARCRSTAPRRRRCRRPSRPAASTRPSETTSVTTAIEQRAGRVRLLGDRRQIVQMPVEIGGLHDDAARLLVDRGEDIVCAGRRRRQRDDRRDPTCPIRSRPSRDNADADCRRAPPSSAWSRDAPSARLRRVAVEPSYIEALATSMPVSIATWVWNSNRYCSVPCAISG